MACDIAPVSFGIQNDVPGVKARRGAALFLFAALAAAAPGPARAAWFSVRDDAVVLRGSIELGDDAQLAAILKGRPDLRVLRLDSYGGSVRGAIALGEAVRRARLATVVDAARDVCDSACTMIFAAGPSRHYLNAASAPEGFNGQSGLGYHRSYDRGSRVRPAMLSQEGERLMIAYYRRMGAPAAVTLALRGAINALWRPNGATALRLGLATSLTPPRPRPGGVSSTSSRRISGNPAKASAFSTTSREN